MDELTNVTATLSPPAVEAASPNTAQVQAVQSTPKFVVVTVTVDNPSDQVGTLEMQGNFDLQYGIQVMTQEAYQQLGPGGISLQAADNEKPVFTFQTGKSTTWVESNPEIQFALQLTDDFLAIEKLNVSGRITDLELKYLGN